LVFLIGKGGGINSIGLTCILSLSCYRLARSVLGIDLLRALSAVAGMFSVFSFLTSIKFRLELAWTIFLGV